MSTTDASGAADAAAGASASSGVSAGGASAASAASSAASAGGGAADPAPETAGPPTMFDVARIAGVSHQTVSRVVNGLSGVAPSTRVRVEAAIAELKYTPSPTARAMAMRRSNSVGLIQAGRPDFGPSNAALGFNEAAREAGYIVSQASMRSVDADSIMQAVHRLAAQRVEAIVLIAGEREAVEVLREVDAGVPVVALASEPEPGMHRVSIDQVAGARLAVEHLIGLGHREIRHVTGPADSMDAAERRRGWAEALREHGLAVHEPIAGDWLPASGYAAGRALLADRDATAVFVANDHMTLGVLHACREAGVAVPADLSVVGFDDIPEAVYFAPPLTTVRQDFDALGRDIMATVLDVLRHGADAPDSVARRPSLAVRESTAPPRR
ncbi:LacI family DNA-binding transcriptional regulator [Agromyces sp. MMS24-JH15]|uniref:LacI family DNA-binding transcriptional regulator n=1 Tax=Agromyces sp. MMS24-JH15 TaxID=3243765 RepID=UPI003749EC45